MGGLHRQVTDAMEECVRQGFFPRSKPPYGYHSLTTDIPARSGYKKRLAIEPKESETVKLIFSLSETGTTGEPWGLKRIAAYLNSIGIIKRGRKWAVNDVHGILRNTAYTGNYVWGKIRPNNRHGRVPISARIPSIVDEKQFHRVKLGLEKRSPFKTDRNGKVRKNQSAIDELGYRSKTLLTGFLKCDICGASLRVITGKSGRYHYYKCWTRVTVGNSLCSCPSIPKAKLEEAIIGAVSSRFQDHHSIDKLIRGLEAKLRESSKSLSKKVEILKAQNTRLKASLETLYEALSEGSLTLDEVLQETISSKRARMVNLSDQIRDIEAQISPNLFRRGKKHTEAFCKAINEALFSDNTEVTKAYLKTVISEIRVTPSEVRVSGKRLQLASAVSEWLPSTLVPRVPSAVSNWCPGQDLNLRPVP